MLKSAIATTTAGRGRSPAPASGAPRRPRRAATSGEAAPARTPVKASAAPRTRAAPRARQQPPASPSMTLRRVGNGVEIHVVAVLQRRTDQSRDRLSRWREQAQSSRRTRNPSARRRARGPGAASRRHAQGNRRRRRRGGDALGKHLRPGVTRRSRPGHKVTEAREVGAGRSAARPTRPVRCVTPAPAGLPSELTASRPPQTEGRLMLVGKDKRPEIRYFTRLRGVSSVGRAPALQAGGRRFEPGTLHLMKALLAQGFFAPQGKVLPRHVADSWPKRRRRRP